MFPIERESIIELRTIMLNGKWLRLGVLGALIIAVSACGSDDDSSSDNADGGGASTAAGAEVETIRIGVISTRSGPYGGVTAAWQPGAELAAERINEAGGFDVGGVTYNVELVALDDRGDANVGLASAVQLHEDDGIDIILGPPLSLTASPIAAYAAENDVLMMTSAIGLDAVLTEESATTTHSKIFMTSSTTATRGEQEAKAIKEFWPDYGRIALLTSDDPSGEGNNLAIEAGAEKLGLDIVASEVYSVDATDFTSVLSSIKESNPDVLVSCCGGPALTTIMRQMEELEVAKAAFVVNGRFSISTNDAVGGPMETPVGYFGPPAIIDVSAAEPFTASEGPAEFLDAFAERLDELGSLPSVGLLVYDYLYMLTEAMTAAGTVADLDAVADSLRTAEYDGLLGPISFDAENQSIQNSEACVVENGEPGECLVLEDPRRS